MSPSIPHLLKITLLVIDRDNEYMRKEAEDILLENLTSYPNESEPPTTHVLCDTDINRSKNQPGGSICHTPDDTNHYS